MTTSPFEKNNHLSESSQASVLLVEDDRSLRRFFEVMLQRAGYRVIAAEDGLEAMKLAMSSTIDVVITDAIMPQLSGEQLARFLRANEKFARLPIVLLTGKQNPATGVEGLVDAVLFKPVDREQLIACLAEILKKSSSTSQS